VGKHHGFTLTRRIKSPQDGSTPLDKGPLRILLFTSLPNDVDPEKERLNVEEEQIQVQEALMPWISKGLVQLKMPDDGRFFTLKELLDSFHPHILFLSGHGRFHHQPHSGEVPYGEFFFETDVPFKGIGVIRLSPCNHFNFLLACSFFLVVTTTPL
jgi:hypothetical protein